LIGCSHFITFFSVCEPSAADVSLSDAVIAGQEAPQPNATLSVVFH
jgi:hypothetical protein